MQFDVYRNPRLSSEAKLLLDIQHDLLQDLETRVVVPLISAALFKQTSQTLHPILTVMNSSYVMLTHRLAAVQCQELGALVTNLSESSFKIGAAVDLLWSGV
jgi:toxin CcdB